MASPAAVYMENVRLTTHVFVSQDTLVTSAIKHVSKNSNGKSQQ